MDIELQTFLSWVDLLHADILEWDAALKDIVYAGASTPLKHGRSLHPGKK